MERSLEDKVSIITGAATGIGRATAELFSIEGASVVVADRNDVEGSRTAASINDRGGCAEFVECDVSKADDVQQMVESAVERRSPVPWQQIPTSFFWMNLLRGLTPLQ